MILGLEIAVFLAGLVALLTGKLKFTPNTRVSGVAARLAGAIWLLPLPGAFLAGVVIGIQQGAAGNRWFDPQVFGPTLALLEGAVTLGCLVVGLLVALCGTATVREDRPRRRERAPYLEEEPLDVIPVVQPVDPKKGGLPAPPALPAEAFQSEGGKRLSGGDPGKKPAQQQLPALLASIGGITMGMLGGLVIGPLMFPTAPGQGFSVAQLACAGMCGGLGGVIGKLIGHMIESFKKPTEVLPVVRPFDPRKGDPPAPPTAPPEAFQTGPRPLRLDVQRPSGSAGWVVAGILGGEVLLLVPVGGAILWAVTILSDAKVDNREERRRIEAEAREAAEEERRWMAAERAERAEREFREAEAKRAAEEERLRIEAERAAEEARRPKPRHTLWAGHTGVIYSVAFSPDGKALASASDDKTIRLWDVATGRNTATLQGHTGAIWSVAFSPDGKALASASTDQTIKLWDVATGKNTATLTGHTELVRSVTYSPDGKTLASGSFDQTIKLWDVATGKTIAALSGHTGVIMSVAFSPDGKTLVSAGGNKGIKLWDVATGKNTASFEGFSLMVWCVAFSPDGKTVASGETGGTVKLWDVATGKNTAVFRDQNTDRIYSLAFSPDGKTLVSAESSLGYIHFWDVATGTNTAAFRGHPNSLAWCVAYSPDGKTLASGSADQTIRLWDVPAGK